MGSVKVGVGIVARHPETGLILLGKRTVTHGHGSYSFPGGHLEYGEEFAACAARELFEETNLVFHNHKISPLKEVATLNTVFHDSQKHYVTILIEGTVANPGELRNMEPDKCEKWEWVTEKQIRCWARTGEETMFLPIVQYYGRDTG